MAITIKIGADGLPQAICDSIAEARDMMSVMSGSANTSASKQQAPPPPMSTGTSTSDSVKAVIAELNDRCKLLLGAIASHPGGAEATQVSQDCGIKLPAFGGLNGAVSKIAENHGLSFDKLVLSEARFKGKGSHKTRYRWLEPKKAPAGPRRAAKGLTEVYEL